MRVRTGLVATLSLLALGPPAAAQPAPPPARPHPGPQVAALVRGADIWAGPDLAHLARRIVNGQHPAVSPDGRWIAFERTVSGRETLWLANQVGGGQRALAAGVTGVGWSPDSARLVGVRAGSLVTVAAATGAVAPVPDSAGESAPRWSPDGTLIVSTGAHGMITRRPDGSSRFGTGRPAPPDLSRDWRYTGLSDGIMPDIDFSAVDYLTGGRVLLYSQITPSWIWYGRFDWGPEDRDLYVEYFVSGPMYPVTQYGILGPGEVFADGQQLSIGGGPWPLGSSAPPPAVTGLAATPAPGEVRLSWDPPDRSAAPGALGVEVRYALGSTAPASAADGLDGGRFLSAGAITGLPPDQDVAVSVFSRDVGGLVGGRATVLARTPHQAATSMTVTTSPASVLYGSPSQVTLAARLVDALDGTPLPGAQVQVDGGPDFGVTTLRTDRSGRAAMSFATDRIRQSITYTASYAGDADHGPAAASAGTGLVLRVTEWVDHARARAGTLVHLAALPTPSAAGLKTYLQTTCGGVACTLGPHDTNSYGRVTYAITAPPRGTVRKYRVKVPGSWDHADSYGPWLTIAGV